MSETISAAWSKQKSRGYGRTDMLLESVNSPDDLRRLSYEELDELATEMRAFIVDAVNAAESARLQWRDLASRADVRLRVIEVVCSDEALHRARLEKRERGLPHLEETTWRAVEQSLDGYAPWTGPSSALPRITIDSVESLGSNVDAALAFIAA